jgi:hypothetical protein
MQTLADFRFDGLAALRWAITAPNGYPSLEQAIASLTVFIAPQTVAQTAGNIFRLARGGPRRTFDDPKRPTLMWDDNEGPHLAFRAAGGPPVKGRHLHLNHIYNGGSVGLLTNLRNLCLTPSFLTKLTDSEPRIMTLLKRRAFVLYGFAPEGEPIVDSYDNLDWAKTLLPVPNLHQSLSDALYNTKGSITLAVRRLGWCFNDFAGDPFHPAVD